MTTEGDWGEELTLVKDKAPDEEEAPAPELVYATVEDLVREQLAPMNQRSLEGSDRTSCPQWWNHAEAIARLEAMWRAWEYLRLDPATGISVWFRDHADPHMAVLLDSDGPFKGCSPSKGHNKPLKALPLESAPPELFSAMPEGESWV